MHLGRAQHRARLGVQVDAVVVWAEEVEVEAKVSCRQPGVLFGCAFGVEFGEVL